MERLQSDPGACFVPLSLSISINKMAVACSGGCQAIVDSGSSVLAGPTQVVRNIFKHINPIPRRKTRLRVMPQDHSWAPHTPRITWAKLSPAFFYSLISCDSSKTLPPIIFNINGMDFPVSPKYYLQKVRGQLWGLVPKFGICKNSWAAVGKKGPSTGQATPWLMLQSPCGWASASHKTNHVRGKGSLGHPSA